MGLFATRVRPVGAGSAAVAVGRVARAAAGAECRAGLVLVDACRPHDVDRLARAVGRREWQSPRSEPRAPPQDRTWDACRRAGRAACDHPHQLIGTRPVRIDPRPAPTSKTAGSPAGDSAACRQRAPSKADVDSRAAIALLRVVTVSRGSAIRRETELRAVPLGYEVEYSPGVVRDECTHERAEREDREAAARTSLSASVTSRVPSPWPSKRGSIRV